MYVLNWFNCVQLFATLWTITRLLSWVMCMLQACALMAVHHKCHFSFLVFSSACGHHPDLDAQIPASPGQGHHFLSSQYWCTQRNIWIWTKLGQKFEPLISHISTLAPNFPTQHGRRGSDIHYVFSISTLEPRYCGEYYCMYDCCCC